MVKKVLTALLCLVLLLMSAVASFAAPFDVDAGAAILMEFSTGQVLFEKNADQPLPPASITKVMALLLVFEALESGRVAWEDMVVISEKAWRMAGSRMYIEVDTEVMFGDLVTGVSVVSGNDASVAVAEHVAGSEEAFVRLMNARAEEIGLTRTRFLNSHGLPAPGHEMSARDMAVLARFLIMNHPKVLEIESQREFTYNNIPQRNRNLLLWRYPGADGLKTGWTDEAGYCLVGTAKQEGIRMISVVLRSESDEARLKASSELLNHGFRDFRLVVAASPSDRVGEAEVRDGREVAAGLTVAKKVPVVVPTGRQGDLELAIAENIILQAPVQAGEEVGRMEVRLDGEVLTTAPLVTVEGVDRASIFVRFFRGLVRLVTSIFTRSGG
jgi:D-alanyl-D-alanine carboxypeptidase (penicillin-binding protein 5/6)